MSSDSEAQEEEEEEEEEECRTHRGVSRRRREEEWVLEHTMRRRKRGSLPVLRVAISGTVFTVVQVSPRPLLKPEHAVSVSESACLLLVFTFFFVIYFFFARCRAAELEEMDKMLLAKSAITGDEQLKKMYKRQSELRKKLAAYRAERQEAQEKNAHEEQRLKAVMDAEKAK
jgi:hypothetical protein